MTFDEMKELLASLAWYDASAYHHENVTQILKDAYPGSDFSSALINFEKCVTMKPCEGNPR
jgi:hypothetical protein